MVEKSKTFTPEKARAMTGPSEELYCLLKDNSLLRFGAYRLRDYDSNIVLMQITEEQQDEADSLARAEEEAGNQSLDIRTIKYQLGPQFL